MAWVSAAYHRTTVKLQDGNSGLSYQCCQLLLPSQNKDAAPESLLNSGDVNLNNLFREGDGKKGTQMVISREASAKEKTLGEASTSKQKKAINLGVNTTRRCRCSAIRSQQEAALRNYFTQGCCSFGLVQRSRANQRFTAPCLPFGGNPFRFNPLKQLRHSKSLFTCMEKSWCRFLTSCRRSFSEI